MSSAIILARDTPQPFVASRYGAFSYAFQPIVDSLTRRIVSYEALIRGVHGEPARAVLQRVPPQALHEFDAESRKAAIALACRMGIQCDLNLNFLPRSLFTSSASMESTLETALHYGLPLERLVIEVTEEEVINDHARFAQLINAYRGQGLKVAIDDFGAGHSGLNLLAEFQPDQLKVDLALVRGIESNGPRQAIVRAIIGVCRDLGIDVIAEGIETLEEFRWFEREGVQFYQGYLFARPEFEALPPARFPQ